MSFWTELRMPTEQELLVGFYDLAGYMRHAEKTEPQELLATMAGYFALTGQIVGDAGGRLIKTLGDAGLVAFPAEAADAGVLALRSQPPCPAPGSPSRRRCFAACRPRPASSSRSTRRRSATSTRAIRVRPEASPATPAEPGSIETMQRCR